MRGWYEIFGGGYAILVPGGIVLKEVATMGYEAGVSVSQIFIPCPRNEAEEWLSQNRKT